MTHLQGLVNLRWKKKKIKMKQQQQKHNPDPINLNLKVVSGYNEKHDSSEVCVYHI